MSWKSSNFKWPKRSKKKLRLRLEDKLEKLELSHSDLTERYREDTNLNGRLFNLQEEHQQVWPQIPLLMKTPTLEYSGVKRSKVKV